MKGRDGFRRLALFLRAAGLALMAVSLLATLLRSGAGSAIAQVLPVPGLGTPVPEATQTPAPEIRTPVSAPRPAATAPSVQHGGPLTFSLTGNLTFGEQSYASTRGDASSPGGLTSSGVSQATNNAGLMVQLERRTGTTTLNLGMPIGVSSSRRMNAGDVQAGYYTPHFGLQYVSQPLSALGSVPLGSTLAGLSLILPMRGGDMTLYEGGGYLDQNSRARVYGVRARTLLGRDLIELGALRAARNDGLGGFDSLVAGFASSRGEWDQLFEGAVQRPYGKSGHSVVSAYQYRADYGSGGAYSTLAVKHISNGFTSVGTGVISGDDQIAAGFRTDAIAVQELFDKSGAGGSPTKSRQGSFSYFKPFGRDRNVTTMWSLNEQRSESGDQIVWLGGAGVQVGGSVGNLSALAGVQATRSTSNFSSPLASVTYQGMFQEPLGPYLAQLEYQHSRQIADGSFMKVGQAQISLTRQWGLTALTLSDQLTHTRTLTSDSVQTAPLLTLSRRLSSVVTLALTYGLQTTRDALNPASNGRTRMFNVQVTAPFGLGNGLVQGRPNPRLPATISGSVINDIGDQGAYAGQVTNGVGNVMVVLDNTQVQRTDLSGRFQFNFVPPGHHTLQVELASLPRGVTPDQPVAGIDVLGGQQGQVIFHIGTYGGVQGHVFGRDADGRPVPVPGVALTIDKTGGFATTGPDGAYGFGRLPAGPHVVDVQVNSLPATVTLPQDMLSQKVIVRNGEIATADFTASPLGSIAGKILFDSSLAPEHQGGVWNAYVVAEPGDFAAIADVDGSFLLDNLPAGTYTLDLDPDTLPADTGNMGTAQSVTLKPGDHLEGVEFRVGRKFKAVVFTLKSDAVSAATMAVRDPVLPPGGATEISVDAGPDAKSVTAAAFDTKIPLAYDRARKKWIGTLIVPLQAAPGTSTIIADVAGPEKATASADVKIDPGMPIATFVLTPHRPMRGQYVQVRARFLADVHPGDSIRWLDGQVTKLGQPLTGRVFEFTVKISVQPMHGQLLTRQGRLPITLR
jgi:hypothetical protein